MHCSAEAVAASRVRVAALLALDGNERCADCNAREPIWCSVNIGVFVCLACAAVHRGIGTHITMCVARDAMRCDAMRMRVGQRRTRGRAGSAA